MEYVFKASAILSIFYICYRLFLQRETFYDANRWFLLLGLMTSALLPLMVIPVYIEVPMTPNTGFAAVATTTQHRPEVFDVTSLFIWGYAIGASFFLGRFILQLFSITTLIKKHNKKKTAPYTFIETAQVSTPFSFFNWIVYNPTQFDAQELDLILQHEKVHAEQKHSVDVLLIDLTTALFWCNPLIWLYRKSLKQNLEFIADHQTQKQSRCKERYQKLLLKTSVPEEKLISINPFYNSTIKKRIVMLHKSKSNLMNTWKYSIIVPLLAIFALTFNTETIAQTTSEKDPSTTTSDQQNILKFVVTKDTKDKQLDFIKEKLAEKEAVISFDDLERNAKDEITGIKIKYDYKDKVVTYSKKLSHPIPSIEISMNPSNHSINIGDQTSALSQIFDVETDEKEHTKLSKSNSDPKEDSFLIIANKLNNNTGSKDTVFIQNTTDKVNNIYTIDDDGKVKGVRKSDHKTQVFNNQKNKPLIIVNGKEITDQQMKAIDPNTIASVNVLKDDKVTKNYGKKGEYGVIIIKLKNTTATSDLKKEPLYILDGKEISKEKMEAVSPDSIEYIDILKDNDATKKYGAKGENGVVIISTKKTD
ncbi:M56 family metallopeptidase [Gelidibacter salicanalis]|uniref:Peptidase M56 domain-containing protein n=1 Tax=Gelidibacter salicanalis TaxID=291193 RepID=A0A934KLH2_9FLAO|nr:M56 family metallopeptidase [Gelidibacter salicanalis]MBJ7879414.1 hypothetical protein [Gelidibacter salicanalis]